WALKCRSRSEGTGSIPSSRLGVMQITAIGSVSTSNRLVSRYLSRNSRGLLSIVWQVRRGPGLLLPHLSLNSTEYFAVLRSLETALIRNKTGDELKKSYQEAQNNFLPLHNFTTQSDSTEERKKSYNLIEERKKDHISHFILRLAYSRSE